MKSNMMSLSLESIKDAEEWKKDRDRIKIRKLTPSSVCCK